MRLWNPPYLSEPCLATMPAYPLRSSIRAVFGPASLSGLRFGGFPGGRKGKKAAA